MIGGIEQLEDRLTFGSHGTRRIERLPHAGIARLTFVVAGTYGASEALLARADVRWSLSPLTFLHEWARVLVVEQVYRAAKIARDEPYHH